MAVYLSASAWLRLSRAAHTVCPGCPLAAHLTIARGNAIPTDRDHFPDDVHYDAKLQRLSVGAGHIDHVSPAMWDYQVSGKRVLRQWFSYRKRDRERPVIGDRRPPSALEETQAGAWLPEYTAELLELLNVLGLLTDMEPAQAGLLARICAAPSADCAGTHSIRSARKTSDDDA